MRTIFRKVLVAASLGLVAAGSVHSMQSIGGATATTLKVNPTGVGHMLVVPYFSAQAGNVTRITITNTDPVNGKAVKIRFRGAGNADNLFDFQVFFSPSDSWSATVDQGPDGRAKFFTNDPSCSKPQMSSPAFQNYAFSTFRLDPNATGSAKAAGTREGYVEIIAMADIQPGSALYTAIRPVNGVAPCSGAAWNNLDSGISTSTVSAANAAGLTPPSTGLVGNWAIFDTQRSLSYSGAATAIQANTDQLSAAGNPVPGLGNLLYWTQTIGTPAMVNRSSYTADPLFVSGVVDPQNYDLPDLSTPYVQNVTAVSQTAMLSAAFAATSVGNEFNTDPAINATTDWVLSMPTRRYSAAFDYIRQSVQYTTLPASYFTQSNTFVMDRKICMSGVSVVGLSSLQQPTYGFCGNVSLLTVNNGGGTVSGTLSAKVALTDI